ncbi:RNA polymerase sigma factor [Rhizobium daejeonense]|uniref:RNA polymerase sigma factor n=2 Tax=Rhizobium daejeonense TaxID=240521 RepID=A0A6M1S0U2_9HYPH|nr:RNA polymerase sigma factor [Rhizobium daejeonense]
MQQGPDGRGPDNRDGGPGEHAPGPGRFERDMLSLLPALRRYSRSLTRSDTEGEDLFQDCVETALAKRGNWRGINLKGWIYAIMTNLHRNQDRQTRRHPVVELEEASDLPFPAATEDPLESRRLHAALNGLPDEQRTVLMLIVVEGHAYHEVAEILEIPIGTVMSRLSRARQRLRDVLAEQNIVTLRRPK